MTNLNVQSSPNSRQSLFLAENRQEFAELLTFIDFADGLTIGFIEINQSRTTALLVEVLREAILDEEMHLEVMNFSREKELRFLKEAHIGTRRPAADSAANDTSHTSLG